jgi:hypothetical protein
MPWSIQEPVVPKDSPLKMKKAELIEQSNALVKNNPEIVAGIFGYRYIPPQTNPLPKTTTAQEDTSQWLKYMGYIVSEKNEIKYFFKDTRSNQVLTLYLGKRNEQGWQLVTITDKLYIVDKNGITIKVEK